MTLGSRELLENLMTTKALGSGQHGLPCTELSELYLVPMVMSSPIRYMSRSSFVLIVDGVELLRVIRVGVSSARVVHEKLGAVIAVVDVVVHHDPR
jgi:hypothetical protein